MESSANFHCLAVGILPGSTAGVRSVPCKESRKMGRTTRWDALVCVVLTFAVCLSLGEILIEPHANEPCATNTACGSCLQQSGCGWCGFPQGCKAGNASGDHQGTCYLSWVFGRSCPDCGSFTNCGHCLKQDYLCGWCGPSQTCITPTYNKTSNRLVAPTCPKDFSNGMEIPCPDCSRGTSCKTCAALDEASGRCGWCDAKQACVEGNRNGPFIFKDACLSWDYLACPFCQYHDNCYDCTHEPNCGWCPARHAQCLTRTPPPQFTTTLSILSQRGLTIHWHVLRLGLRKRHSVRTHIHGITYNRVPSLVFQLMWWI